MTTSENDFEIIAEFDVSSIHWNTVQIATKEGRLFMREGWGCSCNDIEELDFEPLQSWAEVVAEVDRRCKYEDEKAVAAERTEFLSKVAAAMKKAGMR